MVPACPVVHLGRDRGSCAGAARLRVLGAAVSWSGIASYWGTVLSRVHAGLINVKNTFLQVVSFCLLKGIFKNRIDAFLEVQSVHP